MQIREDLVDIVADILVESAVIDSTCHICLSHILHSREITAGSKMIDDRSFGVCFHKRIDCQFKAFTSSLSLAHFSF